MWRRWVAALGLTLGLACLAQAQSPVQQLLLYQKKPVVAASTTTWNPSDKSGTITLSNGNLTATGSGDGQVRSVSSQSSGKYFWQGTVTVGGNTEVGFANATHALGTLLGFDAHSFGYNAANGFLYCVTNNQNSGDTFASGDVISIAFDITNLLVWVRKNSNNWNAIVGADPATGTSGVALSGILTGGGPFYAAFRSEVNNDAVIANFGASSYSPAAPAGFSNL